MVSRFYNDFLIVMNVIQMQLFGDMVFVYVIV